MKPVEIHFEARGLRETIAALAQFPPSIIVACQAELMKAVRVIATDARRLFTPYDAHSARGFQPFSGGTPVSSLPAVGGMTMLSGGYSVGVKQTIPTTTGMHPEFGVLQMRKALLPAAHRRAAEVQHKLELAIARIHKRLGF